MKKTVSKFLLMLTAFLVFMSPSLSVIQAEEVANEFVIVHTNDMHGQMDAKVQELAYLKAYADSVNALAIFDAGDASQGLPLNNITKGARLGEIMTTIGFDAMAIGNHEFDYDQKTVLGLSDGFFKSSPEIPKLGTNVYFNASSEFGKAGDSVFETSKILTKKLGEDNISLSVFGLSTPETYVKADPRHSEGIDFQDPLPALLIELEKEEHKDSDYFVILTHLGTDETTKLEWRGNYVAEELSKNVKHADKKFIVIDGHSHSHYEDGQKFGNNVLYGQTGSSLNNIGTMTIDRTDFSNSVIKTVPIKDGYNLHAGMTSLTPNKEIIESLKNAALEFEDLTKEVILENLPIRLVGDRDPARLRETNLGNLIADSMYDYANNTFDTYTDLAVMNGGGIRANIEPGIVTLKEVITVMPYGNRVVQIDVTGQQVLDMFEHALNAKLQFEDGTETLKLDKNGLAQLSSNPAILHASDTVRLEFNPLNDPGSRVQKLEIANPDTLSMEPIDLNKTYKLATLEFLAVGGDGFKMLGGARLEGANDAEIFADYISSGNVVWEDYNDEVSPYRILPKKYVGVEVVENLLELQDEVDELFKEKELYTAESFAPLELASEKLNNMIGKLSTRSSVSVTEEEYNSVVLETRAAISGLEKVKEEPVAPTEKPTEKPVEKPIEKPKDTPSTGLQQASVVVPVAIAVVAGISLVLLRKKKNVK